MTIKIKEIAIILKPNVVNEFSTVLPNLTEWLKRRKKNVCFDVKEEDRISKIFKGKTSGIIFKSTEEILSETDLIITFGGDGTFIGIARQCNRNSPPIFGINMGRLGFITEFGKHDFYDDLAETLKGKFDTTKLNLFSAEVHKKEGKIIKSYFVNDAVVNKNDISRMFSLDVSLDEEHIYNLSGDGLIVSSPIGSTAYSLAAGGPILHPSVNSLGLTPICPHSLTHRPIVVSDKSKICLSAPSNSGVIHLTLDGQEMYELNPSDKVLITRSSARYVKVINNADRTYFHTLKEKFRYGRRDN